MLLLRHSVYSPTTAVQVSAIQAVTSRFSHRAPWRRSMKNDATSHTLTKAINRMTEGASCENPRMWSLPRTNELKVSAISAAPTGNAVDFVMCDNAFGELISVDQVEESEKHQPEKVDEVPITRC